MESIITELLKYSDDILEIGNSISDNRINLFEKKYNVILSDKVMEQINKIFFLFLLTFSTISCAQYKIVEEVGKEDKNTRKEFIYNEKLLTLFVYFESSLKGDKVYIGYEGKVLVNNILNDCSLMTLGICEIFEVDNSGSITLEINGKEYVIPSQKCSDYRYLIISRNGDEYILTYSNFPKKYR